MRSKFSGWILDVYADRGKGVVVWFVCKDGRRFRFVQDQAVTFYAGGDWQELARMTEFLKDKACQVSSKKRKHLFRGEIDVVAIRVPNGALQRSLFRKLHEKFPDWRLAIAAYNAGEGTVQNLLKRHKATTYDAIASHLPSETQMYVPKVEATLRRREGVKLAELP